MASYKYIKINGVQVNHKLGSVSVQFSASNPAQMSFILELPYGSGAIPVVGQAVGLYLRSNTKVFGGTIDEIQWWGLYQSGNTLSIPIKVVGYDNRLFIRTTRDFHTHVCAHYRSYSGTVDTHSAGSAADWVSGDYFSDSFVGLTLTVNGTPRVVATVPSPMRMTFTTNPGDHAGVAYSRTVYSGDVVKDLLDTYCDFEGFTYTGTSIQQGAAITELLFSPPVPIAEAIKRVLDLNPTFYFICDPNQVCYFAVRTLVAAPSDITDITGPWKRNIKITTTREDVRNVEISVLNIDIIAPHIFSTVGDGVTRSWFLDAPVGKLIAVRLNGVEVNAGDESTSGKNFYFHTNSNQAWQDSLDPVLSSGDTLEYEYFILDSNMDEYSDSASQIARATIEGSGSGRMEEVIDRSSELDEVVAHQKAINSVTLLKENLVKATVETTADGYMIGQVFTLNIANRKINAQVFIDTVTFSDEFAGADTGAAIDFLYALDTISVSRRISSSDVLRSLFGGSSGVTGGVVAGGSGGGSGASLIDIHTLTANATIVGPSLPVDGQILTVFVIQDGTGGWQITWDAAFDGAPVDIGTLPNAVNILQFVGNAGKWWFQVVNMR